MDWPDDHQLLKAAATIATLLANLCNEAGSDSKNKVKHALGIAQVQPSATKRMWAKTFGALLGRYQRMSPYPAYKSTFGEIWKVCDTMFEDKERGFKLISGGSSERNLEAFENDVLTREDLVKEHVCKVLHTHTPESCDEKTRYNSDKISSEKDSDGNETYVVIFDWEDLEMSLDGVVAMERIAGAHCHSLAIAL